MTAPRVQLVVTRHPALVEHLRAIGLADAATEVIAHVDNVALISCKVVAGVLPLHLAAECAEVVEVPLNVPAELRGVELSLAQVQAFAGPPRRWIVRGSEEQAAIVGTLVYAVRRYMGHTYEGACGPCPEDFAAELAHDMTQAIIAAGGRP